MFQIIQIDRSFLPAQRATERHLRKPAYGAHLECRYFFWGGTGRVTSSLAPELPKDPSAEFQSKSAVLFCFSMMEREELVMTQHAN
jgi:hypothetical protein